ncbi:MBL fold metallo-hydrolase [Salana multivorans]
MRLTVLGCTGSMPGPDSPASGYLVRSGSTAMLLDLGSGSFGPLQAALTPHEADAVVLSHLHPDHCADLSALAVWLRYGPGIGSGPMRVLGPEGTTEAIAALTCMTPAEIAETFDVEVLRDGESVQVGELTVEPRTVLHPVPAFGFRIVDAEGAVLGYTGDTDLCEGAAAVARGVDLLLSEAAFPESEPLRGLHLTGSRAGELARDAGAGRLVLTHVQPWVDAEAVLSAAAGRFGGPVELAAPMATYEI